MAELAPVVLFTYKRLMHTQKTIEALSVNTLASESRLFVYSDAPRGKEDAGQVQEVRDYLKSIRGFKSVNVVEREKNLGLADNIISAVTEIVNQYGRIIVLEDDIVTGRYFLDYMNKYNIR